MRIVKSILVILAVGLFFFSCVPDPDHSMRVKNEYEETLLDLKIGDVGYGDISPEELTDYKPIEEGRNDVIATTEESEVEIKGWVDVSGSGSHKWTLTIYSPTELGVEED